MKRIRDPIHGFIIVHDDELEVLQDPLVQRLRRIKQLGFDHYVYPGAVHDRFSHSLGVLSVASRMVESLESKGIKGLPKKHIRLAALTHDVGHTPMSHTLEMFLIRAYNVRHEAYTEAVLEGRGREFIDILREEGLSHNIISSELDADRMDYLLRDSYYCGVKYGQFDIERVIQGLVAIGEDLGVLNKARYALQSFVLARFQMYLQVYMHKTSAAFSVAAARLMYEVNEEYPYPTVEEVRDDPDKLVNYDDVRFLSLIKEISKRDDMLGMISKQLLHRIRFKRLYEKEATLTHKYTDKPRRYHEIIKNLEEIEAAGGLVHAPEFVPLEPPYKDGKRKILVMTEEGPKDIREEDPVLDALSSHYKLIIRVYAIQGYEEEVSKVLSSLGLQTSRK